MDARQAACHHRFAAGEHGTDAAIIVGRTTMPTSARSVNVAGPGPHAPQPQKPSGRSLSSVTAVGQTSRAAGSAVRRWEVPCR